VKRIKRGTGSKWWQSHWDLPHPRHAELVEVNW
jgi:hypothetical protein